MMIGLYGLPSSGKSFIMEAVKNFEPIAGSKSLLELDSNFHMLNEQEQDDVRRRLAAELRKKDNIIVDGHYSFGDRVVFTEEDGHLYDTFIYLYIDPIILRDRMTDSVKNCKYSGFDIAPWQLFEIQELRKYCHENNKDFYVVDNPEKGYFTDISLVLEFINSLACGFSCLEYAKECAKTIIEDSETESVITLLDGDKTLTKEDSSGKLGYSTHLFDNNFYTGFQSWRHHKELADFIQLNEIHVDNIEELGMHINDAVLNKLTGKGYILTSGYIGVWEKLAKKLGIPFFYGNQMAAETKFFIVKEIQKCGKKVKAFGDSMNDYYMLKQADEGYLVSKPDGSLSRSLKGKELEGIEIVRA